MFGSTIILKSDLLYPTLKRLSKLIMGVRSKMAGAHGELDLPAAYLWVASTSKHVTSTTK